MARGVPRRQATATGRLAGAAAVIGALAVAVTGCAAGSASAGSVHGTAVVGAVAAENEYASVLSQIGGRYVRVSSVLQNPNTDPHSFEASPQIAGEISGAELLVQNGAGYDGWMNKLESASPSSSRKVIVVQQVLGLSASIPNPHLWYSPATMPAVAKAMAADLSALRPARAGYFRANLRAFGRSLQPWLTAIAKFRAQYRGATAATTEPVADYLLSAMAITNKTPFRLQAAMMNGTDPAPQDIALEQRLVSKAAVKVFVYNEQVISPLTVLVRQNARKAGVPVVGVYETMPAGFGYQSWMLAEVTAIRKAVSSKISTEEL
jgi:zinc/manganese transport system substrate-binding protein